MSNVQIINDRETGRSKGFGFVTFKDEKSMRDAIEGMNGQELDGRAHREGGGGDMKVVVKTVAVDMKLVVVVMVEEEREPGR
ncbi:hypothetical protein AG4045_001017 [Apium graveolens]|uniref:RRM domain-containing protein n=1 Tax=Apium graveolens TaxID=4045 RepID=A0A6L5BBX0_APIGR|nr:hypothetical protein AG4045_001017 [Apium graveolens]